MNIKDLPTLNAFLNCLSSVFLILGFVAIKKKQIHLHKKMMITAFVSSSFFLMSYLFYHLNVQMVTKYQGSGLFKGIYFFILATHIPLAALIVPFIFYAFYLGFSNQIEKHKKLVRYLWPVWLYVSITGVLIYLMLYVF